MQKIDALVDGMQVWGLDPQPVFRLTHTRVYVKRKLGIEGFDPKRGFAGGSMYFEYIDRLDARNNYHEIMRVTDGTNFFVENAQWEPAMGAWKAVLPVLRALETHTITQAEQDPMELF